ncbi:MAG TPA: metal-dependent hydrolase [Nitrospirota bacterium]|nr:metal-dependent hydrolase [Nitrospirota bacterium]
MDSITHVLAGAVIAGAVKKKTGWTGAAAALAGSFAPDMDMWLQFLGSGTYLKYHRVVANSLPGTLLMPPLLAWVVWRLGKYDNYKVIYVLVLLAYCLHVFMDYTNSYGIKFLWPFSDKWQALDMVFIVDPWITGLLALGLALMAFKARPLPVAALCFALIFSYWGLRACMHSAALAFFKKEYPAAVKVGAFPRPVSPFAWSMVAETPDGFETGLRDFVRGEWEGRASYPRPAGNEAVRRAKEAPNAKIFLDFARFPWTSYERLDGGWAVRFQDLRFMFRPGDRRFVAEVRISDDGRVLGDSFKF